MSQIRAVYGTLKQGFNLHNQMKMEDPSVCRKIWEGWLSGYDMWQSSYPFIQPGTGKIFVEVYEFFNEIILTEIDSIEINAGYQLESVSIDELPQKDVYIYLYPHETSYFSKVIDGNFQ